MRLIAFLSAFGIILFSGYWLVNFGYPAFLRTTGSQAVAEIMLMCCLVFATGSVIWAVKRLP